MQRKRDRDEINVNDLTIGDEYAQALAEGIKAFGSPQQISLKSNNLSDKGMHPILGSLNPDLLHLDISSNPKISHKTYQDLFQRIDT